MSGVVTFIASEKLVAAARSADCVLEMVPPLGAFVPAGAALFLVDGHTEALDAGEITSSVLLGLERTLDQDVAYGMRMLVDMAERSLADSPFLDPTTAVQAIDRLHDCLRQLARRVLPDGRYNDDDGRLRLVLPVMDWDAFVHLAFEEIRLAGARSPQVTRRLMAALDDLVTVALPDRRPVLLEERAALVADADDSLADDRDTAFAVVADRQGIGVRAGRPAEPRARTRPRS